MAWAAMLFSTRPILLRRMTGKWPTRPFDHGCRERPESAQLSRSLPVFGMRTDAPLSGPCCYRTPAAGFCCYGLEKGQSWVGLFYPITYRKWNALFDIARCIAPHCSRKLASRLARFGRRQYETTGSVESRRGGDVYGWRGTAAWPRGRSRENIGFRRSC